MARRILSSVSTYTYMYYHLSVYNCPPCSEEESQESSKPLSVPAFQPSPSTAKKSSQPSKLVDLGAAATFASQQQASSSQPQPQSTGGGELFGIFQGSSQPPQQTTAQGVLATSQEWLLECICRLFTLYMYINLFCICRRWWVCRFWVSLLRKARGTKSRWRR